jgi:putative methyltransferase
MSKHNVYLFAPNFVAGLGKINSAYLPYTVACLWSYAITDPIVNNNFELKKLGFIRDPIEQVLTKLDAPSVCGFSTYIWNEEYNLKLAQAIKQKYPNCVIVFGGPNVPNQEQEFRNWRAAHPWVDTTVRYEGESSFQQLLLDVLKNDVKSDYVSHRIENLEVPSPYLTGLFDDIVKQGEYNLAMTLETNRGCPFQCTFCDWGSLTYSKIKKFPLQRVLDEITWAGENKIEFISVADANFGVFPDRDNEIIDHLIATKQKYGYPQQFMTPWYKNSNEIILDMAEKLTVHGLNRGLTLSVQSMNPATLKAIKRQNMKVNDLSSIFNQCNQRNIPFYTELILGLPLETIDTWKQGHFDLVEMGQHGCIFVFPVEALRNSELAKEHQEYGVKIKEISDYWTCPTGINERQHIVYETSTMTTRDLIEATVFSWMMITFHHHGWTEIYSRYLHKFHGMSFETIYTHLENWIKQDRYLSAELADVRTSTEEFYYGTSSPNYYAIWNTVRKLFANYTTSQSSLAEWFKTLCNDEYTEQVIALQQAYVTDPCNTYPCQIEQPNNLMSNILEQATEMINTATTYTIQPRSTWSNSDEFLDLIVLRRKEGFGKNIIKMS